MQQHKAIKHTCNWKKTKTVHVTEVKKGEENAFSGDGDRGDQEGEEEQKKHLKKWIKNLQIL